MRAVLASLLRLPLADSTRLITHRFPNAWNEYLIEYRYGSSVYVITIRRVMEPDEAMVTVDGVQQPGGVIALVDDGVRHEVQVGLAAVAGRPPAPDLAKASGTTS